MIFVDGPKHRRLVCCHASDADVARGARNAGISRLNRGARHLNPRMPSDLRLLGLIRIPPASLFAMMPDPTTVATSNSVSSPSAAGRRAGGIAGRSCRGGAPTGRIYNELPVFLAEL